MARNLSPKFNQYSKITNGVREILYNIHKTPVRIPNVMGIDNPVIYMKTQVSAYNNKQHISVYQDVDALSLQRYFNNYKKAKDTWSKYTPSDKKDIFLGAANLLENKYYDKMLAYTIAGQNKTIYEAEIDAICELCDFLRFNVEYYEKILKKQPITPEYDSVVNLSEYNSLDGFTTAITPFNFTAIGGNLATAPLLFGNSVLWKPSNNAVLSNYLFYEIMLEAGLPRGILNFCPMEPEEFFNLVNNRNDLSAVLFTGSSSVFNDIYYQVARRIHNRDNYTRLIGETGGKNFHFVDDTYRENLNYLVDETVQSAFGYSGQKCSACSILYLPEKYLEPFIPLLSRKINKFLDNTENYGLVNKRSFKKTRKTLKNLESDSEIDFLVTGEITDKESYFVSPHVLLSRNHNHSVFNEEFFAPILAIYPYKESEKEKTLELCKSSNNYALTGAVFSQDERWIVNASNKLIHKTGNFYVNCRSTGSIVGNQPFGGSGKSGTNDKAGDVNLLYRLFNQRNLKINYDF